MPTPRVTRVDVSTDPLLEERYGARVPVMAIGGTADTDSPFAWGTRFAYEHVASARKVEIALEALSKAGIGRATGTDLDRSVALELVGEGLRSWVALARQLGVDPEQALREADDVRVEAARGRPATGESPVANAHQAGNAPHRYEGT